jgi:hypothetical protein
LFFLATLLLLFFLIQQHLYINALIFLKVSLVSHPTVHYLLTMLYVQLALVWWWAFFSWCASKDEKNASQKNIYIYCLSLSSVHVYTLLPSFWITDIFCCCCCCYYPPTLKKPKFRKIFFSCTTFFCVVGCKSESSPGSLCSFLYTFFRTFF